MRVTVRARGDGPQDITPAALQPAPPIVPETIYLLMQTNWEQSEHCLYPSGAAVVGARWSQEIAQSVVRNLNEVFIQTHLAREYFDVGDYNFPPDWDDWTYRQQWGWLLGESADDRHYLNTVEDPPLGTTDYRSYGHVEPPYWVSNMPISNETTPPRPSAGATQDPPPIVPPQVPAPPVTENWRAASGHSLASPDPGGYVLDPS